MARGTAPSGPQGKGSEHDPGLEGAVVSGRGAAAVYAAPALSKRALSKRALTSVQFTSDQSFST